MDTPEKTTQIANPLSKFEDSPVFNYINNLSPIKPVKSRHITQTFNSLNFASLPSIFTSPHVSSLKETRFLQRNNSPDPSRPVISSSDSGNKAITTNGIAENFDTGVASEDVSADPSDDSKFSVELPQTLTYDCASPSCNHMPSCGIKPNCAPEMEDTTLSVMLYDSSEGEMHLPVRKETDAYDWESLISDAADLLIFNYPHHEPRIQMLKSGNFSQQHEMEDLSVQTRGNGDLPETDQLQDNSAADDLDKCVTADSNQKGDDEPVYNLHRGMRRRCLDFEMVARRKNLDNGSNSNSHMILQSEEKTTSESMHLVTHKPSSDSTRRILPGIGLHLNALAMASQDNKLVNSTASIHSQESQQTGPDSLHESLTSDSAAERDMVLVENGNPLVDDFPQTSPTLVGEELNQSSPKKKRRKAENAGESEGCKRCNCKKSKCLKLYCECFAAGVYCIEPCSCQDCFNKPIHEDTVLATRKQIESRNPLAFAPKVIRSNNTVPEFGDDSAKTPASARHKRGCNCKKSSCLKKYCECYQGGVGCSINCRCEGCKNAFGRKDGSTPIETEARPGVGEEEAMEIHEKCEVDINVQKTEILSNEESNPAVTVTATPLRVCRSLYQLPFSSKGKPPRTVLTIGSSSAFYTGQKYGKPNILRSQHNFVKSFKKSQEDEMPEILQGQGSPLKSVSPNNKRISPPNGVLCSGSGSGSGIGSSPSRRNGRKLILQSIPSFPSLTPHH